MTVKITGATKMNRFSKTQIYLHWITLLFIA
ncbi:cytochrome b, partial [Escherichia coli]|nr:cytochrome b [Escherichia coli]EEX0335227.1 cytochrome b [Escherichia coli]EEX0381305.1 cytochrome b [Escherichia coli]EGD9093645.1 cytochrome b [Escherichia coli]